MLSEPLRNEVQQYINGFAIDSFPYFADLWDPTFIPHISKLLAAETYAPDDILFQ
jgi:hypothetical protein